MRLLSSKVQQNLFTTVATPAAQQLSRLGRGGQNVFNNKADLKLLLCELRQRPRNRPAIGSALYCDQKSSPGDA